MISLLILTHHKPPYSLVTVQVIFPLFCSQVSFHPNISQYSLYFHFSWSHAKSIITEMCSNRHWKMPQTHGFIFQHFGCIIMLYSPITLEIIVLWINIISMIGLKSLEVSEVKCQLLSPVWLFLTPRTIQLMEFSRLEYWSGKPFPSQGDLSNPGIDPRSSTLQADSLRAEPWGKPKNARVGNLSLLQEIFPTQESNWGLCTAGGFFTIWAIKEDPWGKGLLYIHLKFSPQHLAKSLSSHRTGKGSFHSNPKERQCQRVFKLLHNCTHLTR